MCDEKFAQNAHQVLISHCFCVRVKFDGYSVKTNKTTKYKLQKQKKKKLIKKITYTLIAKTNQNVSI